MPSCKKSKEVVFIMNNDILNSIQGQIGYTFKNSDLLQQAFVRRSYSKENGGEDNEVLEFIGDKALDFIVVKFLVEKYGSYAEEYDDYNPYEDCNEFISDFREGKLTEIKKKLVCREMLSSRISIFGFQHELIMGKSDIEQQISDQASVKEDLFEAIIGAVALDSKWDPIALTNVVDLMLEPDFYLENGFEESVNYVELLQRWYQKKYKRIPVYTYFQWNRACYTVFENQNYPSDYKCELGLYPLEQGFCGYGDTKSKARMAVAEQAYRYLEENGLLLTLIDEIGEPDLDRAINQLQELYQKGYIGEPWYDFTETYDEDGNPLWHCECHVEGREIYFEDEYKSKKYGKKAVAYDMLCDVIGWGEDDET
jgi:ribonuclease-3